ncbi:RING finger protein [Oscillospiraceae bacterium MB08-C2-2]|nr:RING finger protein [Oscillospiraceae bacterium MB08-C2-2]
MANYIGVRCPVCDKKFSTHDDIVVCPKCGAPHHRECYAQVGDCAFAKEHMTGKAWVNPLEQQAQEQAAAQAAARAQPVRCERCNAYNPGEYPFCQVCGAKMPSREQPEDSSSHTHTHTHAHTQNQPENWPQPGFVFSAPETNAAFSAYGGLNPDESIAGESVRDIAFFLGARPAYYLHRFKLFDQTKRMITANWSAAILGFMYYFYRKMYKIGVALLAVTLVCMIPRLLYAYYYTPYMLNQMGLGPAVTLDQTLLDFYAQLSNITTSVQFGLTITLSFFANRIYYKRVIDSVKTIRESTQQMVDEQTYVAQLSTRGGISVKAVGFVILAVSVIYFLASFGVAVSILY